MCDCVTVYCVTVYCVTVYCVTVYCVMCDCGCVLCVMCDDILHVFKELLLYMYNSRGYSKYFCDYFVLPFCKTLRMDVNCVDVQMFMDDFSFSLDACRHRGLDEDFSFISFQDSYACFLACS